MVDQHGIGRQQDLPILDDRRTLPSRGRERVVRVDCRSRGACVRRSDRRSRRSCRRPRRIERNDQLLGPRFVRGDFMPIDDRLGGSRAGRQADREMIARRAQPVDGAVLSDVVTQPTANPRALDDRRIGTWTVDGVDPECQSAAPLAP